MNIKKKSYSVFCLVLALNIFSPIVFGQEIIKADAVLILSETEDSLENAYISLLEIERAGGDITGLVKILNTATGFYSEALRLFESGEYALAVELADKAIDSSNVILETDVRMMSKIEIFRGIGFRNQLYISIGTSGIIILLSFLGWKVFKTYHFQKFNGVKPEVSVDES